MKNMSNMPNMNNMNHSMVEPKEIIIMMVIMFIAGLLSSMNMWVEKLSDMRFHLNDVYMALLMCGWSLVIMGIYYIKINILIIGIIFTILIIYCIRNQIFINENQFLNGMIPHHSMAVLMSKKLLEKEKNKDKPKDSYKTKHIQNFAKNIITNQNDEIKFMKFVLKYKNNLKNVNNFKYIKKNIYEE